MTGASADEMIPDHVTIHGLLADGLRRAVTILDAICVHRSYNIMAITSYGTSDQREGTQSFIGLWLIHGDSHVDIGDEMLGAVIFASGIDEWVSESGIELHSGQLDERQIIEYSRPFPRTALIPGTGSSVSVQFQQKIASYVGGKLDIGHDASIHFDDIACHSLDNLNAEYLAPTLQLVSIMLRRKCELTRVLVLFRNHDWYLEIFHPLVQPDAKIARIDGGFYYLGLPNVGVGVLARWLGRAVKFSPVPNILVGQMDASRPTMLESGLLLLATCAEGFDRRQYGDKPIIDSDIAKAARRAAKAAIKDVAGSSVAERASSILMGLDRSSYSERLDRLIDYVEPALPGIFGNRQSWKKHVKNARNGFAHLLDGPGNEMNVNIALRECLGWVLGAAILREAGISAQKIRSAAEENQDYIQFRIRAAVLAPSIYADDRA